MLARILVPLLALAVPAAAWAQAPVDRRALDAKKACIAGRVDLGVEILAELYAETNEPNYLYNQARCYQQNDRLPQALSRFREYLRKAPTLAVAERTQVDGYIKEIEGQIEAARGSHPAPTVTQVQQPVANPAVPVEPTAGRNAAKPVVADADLSAVATPGKTAGGPDTNRRLRIAGIAAGAVGALALTGGIIMGLRVSALEKQVNEDSVNHTFDETKYASGRSAETFQWVGLGIGITALAGGAILYGLGYEDARATDAAGTGAGPSFAISPNGGSMRVSF